MKTLYVILFTCFLAAGANGQAIERIHQHQSASEALGQERSFRVQVPASYDTHPSHQFPVLYLLDGDQNLDHTGPVVDFLAESGKIPEMIVVAIDNGATRSSDFMPSGGAQANAPGGRAAFLTYIEDELMPFIEGEYRAAPVTLLSGHSLGGLFATWVLFTQSDVADGYLTQSPYLAADMGTGLLAQFDPALIGDDAFYHAVLGAEPDLAENFRLLEDKLTTMPSDALRWSLSRHENETHMSTRLIGVYEGLSAFFADHWVIDSAELAAGGVSALSKHIDGLSETYGYPVLVGEQPFQELAQRFLASRDMASARQAAELYVQHHDGSVVAHFMLGVALVSSGERDGGLAEINRAIALYEAAPDASLAPVYAQLKQIKQQLGQ